jgi:hypothetical protein
VDASDRGGHKLESAGGKGEHKLENASGKGGHKLWWMRVIAGDIWMKDE